MLRGLRRMPPIADALRPLEWLLGRWKAVQATAIYPTMKDFTYDEELEFTHSGQPNIQFTLSSFHPESKAPMHREIGFIRIKPGTNCVAYISSHNIGLADLEEGVVEGQQLTLETTNLGRMSFGKPPAVEKLKRVIRREGDFLEQIVDMATSTTPLTRHLFARYEKLQ